MVDGDKVGEERKNVFNLEQTTLLEKHHCSVEVERRGGGEEGRWEGGKGG